jgi:hypothetical protein
MPTKKPVTPLPSTSTRFAARMSVAAQESGVSEPSLYRLLAMGKIKGKKNGRTTLILMETLRNYIQALPDARYAPPAGPKGQKEC